MYCFAPQIILAVNIVIKSHSLVSLNIHLSETFVSSVSQLTDAEKYLQALVNRNPEQTLKQKHILNVPQILNF